jgi:hypothetical protein
MGWLMRLQYRLDLGEVLELNVASRLQRLKGGFTAALGAGQILVGAWLACFRNDNPASAPVFIAGTFFLFLGLVASRIAGLGAWLLGCAPQLDLEITSGGVTFLNTPGTPLVSWDQFTRWHATTRLLVLEIGWNDALAVPKRSCDPASWDELVEWVRFGINPERVKGR